MIKCKVNRNLSGITYRGRPPPRDRPPPDRLLLRLDLPRLLLARELGSRGGFRVLITALFGLIHGLGFAGAFLASDVRRDMLLLPLAGFNIGVELGQLALVAVMLSLGVLMKRQVRLHAHATELISALVCGLGVFWFVQRSFV